MTSIPQRIADLQVARAMNDRREDFISTVKFLALGRGATITAVDLARKAGASDRVVDAIRAAQEPMSIGSVGTSLSPFQLLAQSFFTTLANASAFDTMLPFMVQVPFRSRVVSTTVNVTGVALAEQAVKRVSALSLSPTDLEISKAAAIIALTAETLRAGGEGAARYLDQQLRIGVALATDTQFLALITAGATSIPSSGSNASAMRLDIRALLQTITLGATSRPFLITSPDNAAGWATVGDTSGAVVFGDSRWNGGTIGGIPIIVSDGAPAQQIILADATGIAANSEGMRIDSSTQTALQLDTSPDSPPIGSSALTSLWQADMTAIKAERVFGAKVVRPNAVALVTGANYTGGSPS